MVDTYTYTKKEEIANAITHGIGALLSVAALVLLIIHSSQQGSAWYVVSFTIYGATMLLLYVSSTLVHSFPEGRIKNLFEIFDHASIYLFIAGTYTPFLFLVVQGAWGWSLFGIVWGMALLGVTFKAFYAKKFVFLSTLIYILMGWLIVLAWKPLIANYDANGIVWLVAGGLLYTVGTIFYVWRSFPFHHAVWHLFVLGGSFSHFMAIYLYV